MNLDSLVQDPEVLDWSRVQLADSWADGLRFDRLSSWRAVFGERRPVRLPDSLPGSEHIPAYALQEFHNVPNGNYSNRLTRGYIQGFEVAMLGMVEPVRDWIAERLAVCGPAALDVGTTGGRTAAALVRHGVRDVWGVDPSPYLLKHAAARHAGVRFTQGVAERLPFRDRRFDAVALCFVLHEIPGESLLDALRECRRLLAPGGRACIAEPSEQQLEAFAWRDLLPFAGWKKAYFRMLAGHDHEPFVMGWHARDKDELFARAGFRLLEDLPGMPINRWLLEAV